MNKLKILITILSLLCVGRISYAEDSGNLGVGIILGDPTGPTAKYWLSEKVAFDIAVGFQEDVSVHGDILFQAWDLFPQPEQGKLGAYLGFGTKIQEKKKDNLFGIRVVGGLNYWTPKYPFEIFLELVPIFELSPDTGTGFDAGTGFRYYFHLK